MHLRKALHGELEVPPELHVLRNNARQCEAERAVQTTPRQVHQSPCPRTHGLKLEEATVMLRQRQGCQNLLMADTNEPVKLSTTRPSGLASSSGGLGDRRGSRRVGIQVTLLARLLLGIALETILRRHVRRAFQMRHVALLGARHATRVPDNPARKMHHPCNWHVGARFARHEHGHLAGVTHEQSTRHADDILEDHIHIVAMARATGSRTGAARTARDSRR